MSNFLKHPVYLTNHKSEFFINAVFFKRFLQNHVVNCTVEPCRMSASLYEKFALRAAICKEFCLIQQVKIRCTSDRRPSTSRGLKIRF